MKLREKSREDYLKLIILKTTQRKRKESWHLKMKNCKNNLNNTKKLQNNSII